MRKINVALVGLGFGGAFAEIYKSHPNVNELVLFDTNKELERQFREKLGIQKQYTSFDEILKDKSIDAIHLVTPIPLHEKQSVQVLNAGKHCACTVPMAISLDGIQKIIDARKKSGKKYMLMETTLYTYQFHYVQNLIRSGKLGKIQFLRGSHYQDMSGWPDYWMGLPPMYYGTHAISPMRVLADSPFKRVICMGSGTMNPILTSKYQNPYPIECALFEFENGLKAEATRSLFETARAYQEGMFVYGSKMSFEWGFEDHDKPYITTLKDLSADMRGKTATVEQINLPNFPESLPEELYKYTVGKGYDPLNPQLSLMDGAGAGHHGSHPHLVHAFIQSIIEDIQPPIDISLASNITAACICAHESALLNGKEIEIPHFQTEIEA